MPKKPHKRNESRRKRETALALVPDYSHEALRQLATAARANAAAHARLVQRIVQDVKKGRSLFVFGSGHSAILTQEVYHRAGGASFVVPVVADYLLPTAGPPVVRVLERTPSAAVAVLRRAGPRKGEMIWISSQSGINGAVVEFALEARKMGLYTVAFTSLVHSRAVESRHPSGKRLFEVCDEVMDLGGYRGDACVSIPSGGGGGGGEVRAGPLSTLTSVFLAHSILVDACAILERGGLPCVYTSVNTPEGEQRNRAIEARAALRDPALR